jgi:hypothetical protein
MDPETGTPRLRQEARIALGLLPLLLAGCFTSHGKWTYPSGRYPTSKSSRPAPASVVVMPFLDARTASNVSSMVWYYIPLFPMGWSDFDRPEAVVHGEDTTDYLADPPEDLARSLVIELRRQELVKDATFAGDFRTTPDATHLLRGTLRVYYVGESRWSYGLSIYSPALWALALPMGRSLNAFHADLELVDLKDGRVVWKDSIYDSDNHIEGYYYGPEWYRFPRMWELRLREKMGGLARALGAEPAPLPPALEKELRESPPPAMPPTLGVDLPPPPEKK